MDVEPKDYLFQTIIDIANNPAVKNLFEKYKYDLFKVYIDRSIYCKIFFRNSRLLFNVLFTKSYITYDYLDKCYNRGIKITNILGEDKLIETIENVKITNRKLFDELHNIISKDEELSKRLSTLKEMNKGLNPVAPFKDRPIICYIAFMLMALFIILSVPFSPVFLIMDFIIAISESLSKPILEAILFLVFLPIYLPISIIFGITVFQIGLIALDLIIEYDCIKFYP